MGRWTPVYETNCATASLEVDVGGRGCFYVRCCGCCLFSERGEEKLSLCSGF